MMPHSLLVDERSLLCSFPSVALPVLTSHTVLQGCEDMIVESISLDNLVSILRWSGEAHGSAWVHRQALHFLREEFSQVRVKEFFHGSESFLLPSTEVFCEPTHLWLNHFKF